MGRSIAPHGAPPAPVRAVRGAPAAVRWLMPARDAITQERQTLAALRITAHELRANAATSTRAAFASPGAAAAAAQREAASAAQRDALCQLAHFMRRAQPSQLRAIRRSAVVHALVRAIDEVAAPAEPNRADGSERAAAALRRPPVRRLAEPKLVAVGLSALANLLYIGGQKLASRAGALPLLVRLLELSAEEEVQSYTLAALQNLSAAREYAPALLAQPTLLPALREAAVLLPDGDARFYFAAGALTNLVKLASAAGGDAHALRLGACAAGRGRTAAAIALSAADAEMVAIIERRAALKRQRAVSYTHLTLPTERIV